MADSSSDPFSAAMAAAQAAPAPAAPVSSGQTDPFSQALAAAQTTPTAPSQPDDLTGATIKYKEDGFPEQTGVVVAARKNGTGYILADGNNVGSKLITDVVKPVAPAQSQQEVAPSPSSADAAVTPNNVARSVATGIPVVGGLLNQADAATNAGLSYVLNPLFPPQNQLTGSLSDRFSQALATQNGIDKSFADANPTTNAVLNTAGAILGTAPLMAAAPVAMGVKGSSLLGRMAAGALSGAALNGTDSFVRSGADLDAAKQGAETGAIFGGAAPVIGKAIGAVGNKLLGYATNATASIRNVANALTDAGFSPEQAQAQLARMGPNATLADLSPALGDEAGGIAATGGKPAAILKQAYADRGAGADARINDAVTQNLGARPDLTNVKQGVYQEAKDEAAPLYEKAFKGGSIAPLQTQLEGHFSDAVTAERSAQKELADANNAYTQASAQKSRAGENVYGNAAANKDLGAAKQAIEDATAKVQAAQATKAQVLDKLRSAQTDVASNAPGAVWSPAIQRLLDNPVMKGGINRGLVIQRLEADAAGKPFNPSEYGITGQDASGDPIVSQVPNMRLLDAGKRGLDAIIQDNTDPVTGRVNEYGRAVDLFRKSYLSKLDEANPDYKVARAAWESKMKNLEAVQEGQDIFKKSTRIEDFSRSVEGMDPDRVQYMRQGALVTLHDAIDAAAHGDLSQMQSILGKNTANRQKLTALFPKSQEIFDNLETEMKMRATEQNVRAGSQTASRRAISEKYSAPTTHGGLPFEGFIGGEAGGVPGAIAGTVWRALVNNIKGELSASARNKLLEGSANALSASGENIPPLLDQIRRANGSRAINRLIDPVSAYGAQLTSIGLAPAYQRRLTEQPSAH